MTHEITCDVNVKHKFSAGSYQLPLTVFDKLSEAGIDVQEEMKYYPYRATFDYECYFQSVPPSMHQRDGKLRWEARHECLSGDGGGLGYQQWAPDIADLESDVLWDGVVPEDFNRFPDSSWVPMLDGGDEFCVVPFDAVV